MALEVDQFQNLILESLKEKFSLFAFIGDTLGDEKLCVEGSQRSGLRRHIWEEWRGKAWQRTKVTHNEIVPEASADSAQSSRLGMDY